ncbi:MAG: radical SAM protein [Sutterellaceae bacterium]|nr:radical SAM protein [Sutterellaceae bacterium]
MLYQIWCAAPKKDNSQAKPEAYLYNNLTNEVIDPQGNLVDFKSMEAFSHLEKVRKPAGSQVFSPQEPVKGKGKVLAALKIQLGMACNYHCKYCMQAAFRKQGPNMATPETIEAYFKKLDDLGITVSPNGRIELWGGEPLVYWKALQVLIPKIREKWGNGTMIKMVTNGSLLTHAIVDFLVKYGVTVIISHDGPGFSLRDDVDPLKVPQKKAVWRYLQQKSREAGVETGFNVVITPQNCDVFKIRDYFFENLSPETQFGFEGVVTDAGAQAEGCGFTPESARTLDSSIFRALISEPDQWFSLEHKAQDLMRRIVYRVPASDIQARCESANPKVLVTDLEGRVVSCQNRPSTIYSIGHLSDYDNISNGYFTHWSRRPVCRHCMVLSTCDGSCPHLTDEELSKCCANEFLFHSAIFGAVWYRLTGMIMLSAHPVWEGNQDESQPE